MTTASLRATMIPAVTLAATIALGGLIAPSAARAYEFCSLDVDRVMSCSFDSIEQCQATRSGIGGICFRDPSLKDTNIATINRNVYAYAPYPNHGRHVRRGSITKTNN